MLPAYTHIVDFGQRKRHKTVAVTISIGCKSIVGSPKETKSGQPIGGPCHPGSASFLAEISVSSPRKIIIFII